MIEGGKDADGRMNCRVFVYARARARDCVHACGGTGGRGQALMDADVVLYPSRWDGFGLSMLEALHAGL